MILGFVTGKVDIEQCHYGEQKQKCKLSYLHLLNSFGMFKEIVHILRDLLTLINFDPLKLSHLFNPHGANLQFLLHVLPDSKNSIESHLHIIFDGKYLFIIEPFHSPFLSLCFILCICPLNP